MRRPAAVVAPVLLVASLGAGASLLRAQAAVRESVPLSLYQLLARAPIVIHGRVVHGAGRLAEVKVMENFRGKAPAETIRLDFREVNYQTAGKGAVVFLDGEEYIFFLEHPDFRKPSKKKEDIFGLYHGREGFRKLPEEGAGETIEAMRQLASVMDLPPAEQAQALRQRAQQQNNSFLKTTSLDELLRLREGERDDLDWLQRIVKDPDPAVRSRAAAMMSRVFLDLPPGSTEQERPSLESIRERAHGDPDSGVRAASVRALGSWPDRDQVVPDLQSIGTGDESQDVRYEARRLLFLWGRSAGPS